MIAHFITSWLTQHIMPILPWVWLAVAFAATVWAYISAPLVVSKNWRTIGFVILVVFCALWVWQHFAVFADLKKQNDDLKGQLATTQQQVTNLNGSITNYTDAVGRLEQGQRRIASEIKTARVGLNSATAIREAQDDPIKASTDLSDRYNRLNGMFDAASNGFGQARPTSDSPVPDPNAAGRVEGDQAGTNR